MGLRRAYHRHFRRRERFLVAAVVTIVVVAFVVVPWVTRVLEGLAGYGQGSYNPRDFARNTWVRSVAEPEEWTAGAVVNAGLIALLVLVWFMSAGGRPR
jgi:hypothetical protein